MRTARSGYLETRSARLRLKPAKKPYWSRTGKAGVHIGYRRKKPRTGEANGSWIIRRYTGDGYETEVFGEADDYSEADGASVLTYAQAMVKAGAELSQVQRAARYTVREAVADYVENLRTNNSEKAAQDAEWKLQHYVLKYFDPEKPVASLTIDDFDGWPKWAIKHKPPGRRKKPAKVIALTADNERQRKETVNRVLNIVKACFNRAHEIKAKQVPSDAAWRNLKRFRKTKQSRKSWLTTEQCTRLANGAQPAFRKIVQGALLSGARWSELRGMEARDFNPDPGTILVHTGKTDSRQIQLSDEGVAAFEEWTVGLQPSDLIFTRADGGPWGEQDQKRPMADACEAAGINPTVGFHTLRHTYASSLVQRGVPLAYVAQALGHKDIRMVSEHYGHLAPSDVANAIRAHLPKIGVELSAKVKKLKVGT